MTLILTGHHIYHYVVFPLVASRFDGVIIYIDDWDVRSWSGYVSFRVDGRLLRTVYISGDGHREFTFRRPSEAKDWFIFAIVYMEGMEPPPPSDDLRLRVVDGRTRRLLVSGEIKRPMNAAYLVFH